MVDLRKVDPTKANLDHEKSRIRFVEVNDPEEKKRLWEIETDPEVARFVEDLSETEEDMLAFTKVGCDYLVLAVCGKEGHVDDSEVNKLQGWLTIYKEEKKRLSRFVKEGVIDLVLAGKRILEVGFARHPKAKSGQMASALRQTLAMLQKEHQKDGEHELIVTAYVDETNLASVRVLEAAGFRMVAKVKYHLKNKSFDHFFIWDGK